MARITLAAGIAGLLTACGGGAGPDGAAGPTPTFTLVTQAITPDSLRQGDSASAAIAIVRSGGFRGPVTFTMQASNDNLTGAFSVPVLTDTAATTSLRLFASAVAPVGPYDVVVRAESPGLPARVDTLRVGVIVRPITMTLVRNGSTPLIMAQGGLPISFEVILNRDGLQGDVRFDVAAPLPTGVTATFAPTVTTSSTSIVTLTAGNTATPGTYSAVLRVSAANAPPATVTIPFTVTPPATVTLSLAEPTMTLLANGSGGVLATMRRTNTAANLELSATGQPPGVVVSFEREVPTNGNDRYTVRVALPATIVPGSYPITVRVAVAGTTGATATLTLIVTPPPTNGLITFRFCGPAEDRPIWFAYSRGAINWIRVMPEPGDVYTFSGVSMTDVVWVTQHGPDDFHIHQVRDNRSTSLGAYAALRCPSPSGRTATGRVAGVLSTDQVQVGVGPRAPTVAPSAASPTFSVGSLPDGALDVIAVRTRLDTPTSAFVADRILLQRGLNPASGASVGTLDLSAAGALVPVRHTLTVQGANAGDATAFSAMFHTAAGGSVLLGQRTGASSLVYGGVPDATRVTGDLHEVTGSATHSSGGITTRREVSQWGAAAATRALLLGEAPLDPRMTHFASDGFWARHQVMITEQADYLRMFILSIAQQSGAARRRLTFESMSNKAEYFSPPSTQTMRVPDFGGAPGWNVAWLPRLALPVNWAVEVQGWGSPGGVVPPRGDGVVVRRAVTSGVLPAQ